MARTLSIVAIAVFLAAAGLAAFVTGYLDQTLARSADANAVPAQTLRSINALESALGYGGFLTEQRRLRDRPDAARAMAQHLEAAMAAFKRLGPVPADTKRELEGILAAYEAALQSAQSGYAVGSLEGAYFSLQQTAQRLRQGALNARLDSAAAMTQWAQWSIGLSLGLLALGLLVVASILSRRSVAPLNQLRASLASSGRDPEAGPIWGIDRKDEVGAVARAAERLRKTLVETPVLPALREGQALRIKLDGPAAALFERLVQDIAQAGAHVEASGSVGREQLNAAAQRLAATAAEISGFAGGARAEVNAALATLRAIAPDLDIKDRVAATLDELAAATQQLKATARDAQASQATVSQFAQTAPGLTAEAIGLLRGSGQTLSDALAGLDGRMAQALTSVSDLTERLSASAATLNSAAEESARRLAAAAKDMEGRSKDAELRLGLALDQAGQNARAQAAESAALKSALSQALDDIRQARSGLETAHGAPGMDLSQVLNAVQDLQSLLVQKAGAPGDPSSDSSERPGMAPMKSFRATPFARLPIAASDMLARLGSIAAEVRAAAGHDLSGIRAIADELAGALSVSDPNTDWASYAAALEAEAAQLSVDLAAVRESAAKTVEGLSSGAAIRPSGRASLAQQVSLLLADIAEADKFEPPQLVAVPQSGADALEAAAQDIQRLSDIIADLEARTEALAQTSALAMPEAPDGVISAQAARADQKTNEAIVSVMESIERLNNIAQSLSRAGDFQAQRKAGE